MTDTSENTNTKLKIGPFVNARWKLAKPIWLVLIAGYLLSLACITIGCNVAQAGAILIGTSIIAGWQFPKLQWRDYLKPPHKNDIWITIDGPAYGSGFLYQEEFSPLTMVAQTSKSKSKPKRSFVRTTGLFYERVIEALNVFTVLLGTVVQVII